MRLLILIAIQLMMVGNSRYLTAKQTVERSADSTQRSAESTSSTNVQFRKSEKSVDVLIDGLPFTTLNFGSYAKPILYPILGPGQIGMTRSWPMKDGVKGEAHDHPHHKSMWISHEISGVDFWAESGGKVVTQSVDLGDTTLTAKSVWIRKSDGKTMLTDTTVYRFGTNDNSRWIDCTIQYHASHGDFQFDDTKEGLFAIRTHPDLRLTANPKQGVTEVFGRAVNSEGETGKTIWGKPAKWLLYQGPIDGTPMSFAMYDDPDNLRHPTTWHARDYGLVTANPFGQHHFLGKESGAGAFQVMQGDSLTLHYRVEFIQGLATADEVETRYAQFCGARR